MKTVIVWGLLIAVPIIGSLFDFHKHEKPKRHRQLLQEININDTLNITDEPR